MTLRRFRATLGVDLRFHVTRPLVWVLLVLLGFLAFGLSTGNVMIASGDTTVGGDQVAYITSEFALAKLFPLVMFLFYTFFAAIAGGMAIPRDEELKVGPILHATKLSSREYIWAKFGSVLLVFTAILAIHVLLQIFFNHVWSNPGADQVRGPFELINYVRPALILGLPCLVFFCGISFLIGEWTRKPILIFVTPIAFFLVCVFFLFDWSPTWLDPRINQILMWIEPSGFRWISETWVKVDRGVDFYNTQPVGYDFPFLMSRLGYFAVGLLSVWIAERHFTKTLRGASAARAGKTLVEAPAATPETAPIPTSTLGEIGMTASPPSFLKTVLEVVRFESTNLRSQPGLYLFVPIILMETIFNQFFAVGAFGTPLLLTSGMAAVSSMNTLTLLVCFLILFYTVESVMREHLTGLSPIYNATPAQTAAVLFGKSIANGLVGAVILLAAMVGSWIVILAQGKVQIDIMPFLLVWGLLLLPTFLVWSSFVTWVLALTWNRYATYAVGLATFAFTGWKQFRGEVNWVGNWNLWATTTWTDFGTLQPNETALFLNRIFYLLVMLFLIAFTVRLYPRRERDSAMIVNRLRPGALLRTGWRLAIIGLPAIAVGIALYVQVGQGFQGSAVEERETEYWRRNLATWAEADVPQLGGADLDVELDPAGRSFRVEGSYDLVNLTDAAIPRFPMSVGNHFEDLKWTLDGVDYEPEHWARLYVFTPEVGIAPGDTLQVGFSHHGSFPKGLTKNGGGLGNFVLPAGVVLTSFNTGFVPVPIFQEGRGMDDKTSLEPKSFTDGFWEGKTPPALGTGARFPVRTRITGPADYDYHAVGIVVEESEDDGKKTVVYETDHPVNFFNIVAGKWAHWEGDGVDVYHHPDHTYNLDEIGAALEASRKYYSEWFYPYPWQKLRLSEFPGIASYAQGFPTNITFSETIGFLTRSKKETNAAFLVTAHEAAHQWWGNILMPGEGPGGNVLSEGAAHFSTILLFEKIKGDEERIEFCKRLEESYGENRRADEEKPLAWTLGDKSSDTTVMYDKGGWVFWMLHELMGRDANLEGIRSFMEVYSRSDDYPVLQDFVRDMRPFAPDTLAYDAFVDQWFFDVVLPEYRISEATSTQNGSGWIVTAQIENRGTGDLPLVIETSRGERFVDDEKSDGDDESEDEESAPWMTARSQVRVAAGETASISISCDFEPERLVLDPDVLLLMLERTNASVDL